MSRNITNLKNVSVLNREQLKRINAGYRNCVKTGISQVISQPDNTLTFESTPVAITCQYTCEREFLGIAGGTWGYVENVWGAC